MQKQTATATQTYSPIKPYISQPYPNHQFHLHQPKPLHSPFPSHHHTRETFYFPIISPTQTQARLSRVTSLYPLPTTTNNHHFHRQQSGYYREKERNERIDLINENQSRMLAEKQRLIDELWELNNNKKYQNEKLKYQNQILAEQLSRNRVVSYRHQQEFANDAIWDKQEDMLATFETDAQTFQEYGRNLKKVKSMQLFYNPPEDRFAVGARCETMQINCCKQCAEKVMGQKMRQRTPIKMKYNEKIKQKCKRTTKMPVTKISKQQNINELIMKLKKQNKYLKNLLR